MRTGKVSSGPTSMLGTETEALPPGVTSWARTIRVTPRILFWVMLRSDRDVWRSRTRALPRVAGRDCPQSPEATVTGESFGKSMAKEPCGAWANAALEAARTAANATKLLRVDIGYRHLSGVGVYVARAQ